MTARNEITGEAYKGKNIARVLVAEAEKGYSSERGWAGYGQWLAQGRQVRKGEKSTRIMVVFVGKDGTKGIGSRAIFHWDQTEVAEAGAKPSKPRKSAPALEVVPTAPKVAAVARDARGRAAMADPSALLARLGSAVK